MEMKKYIPGWEDKTVRQRVWELEKKAGSLPMIFAVLFGAYITAEVKHTPVPLPDRYKILVTSLGVAILFIYRDKKERATNKMKEQAEKVKERRDQMKVTDYTEKEDE